MMGWISPRQRGFIPRRSLCLNVVEADRECRVAGFERLPGEFPSAWSLDLAASFPSIARMWMQFVLEAIEAPKGLSNMVQSTHAENWVLETSTGDVRFMYELASGVQQGCPFTGLMFAICFDACVRGLSASLGLLGVIWACADDVFLVLRSMAALSRAASMFLLLKRATCLTLNVDRMLISALECPCGQELRHRPLRISGLGCARSPRCLLHHRWRVGRPSSGSQ